MMCSPDGMQKTYSLMFHRLIHHSQIGQHRDELDVAWGLMIHKVRDFGDDRHAQAVNERTEDARVVNESTGSHHGVGPEPVPVVCPDSQNNDILHHKLRPEDNQDEQAGRVRGDDHSQIDSHHG